MEIMQNRYFCDIWLYDKGVLAAYLNDNCLSNGPGKFQFTTTLFKLSMLYKSINLNKNLVLKKKINKISKLVKEIKGLK